MKRFLSLLAILLICAMALSACGTGNGSGSGTDFNLADLSNPFIGEWQSDIPSANTTLTFNYKADGTFDYEMAGVPADQGGKGTGGYVVFENIQISWLDFEGAAAYTFEVVDNNTINVTELEFGENGEKVSGNTSPFTRVEGSAVNTKDVPFKLSNDFLGKWQSEIPSANATLIFDYKADGTFDFEMPGVPEDQGSKGIGCYIVYGDKQVSYLDFEGVASYSFKVADADTINVTELEPNETGELVPGNTAPFVRVK
jgi:predicted small secreted protein